MEKGLPFESGTGLTNVTREPGYVGQSIGEIIIQSGQSYPGVPSFSIPRVALGANSSQGGRKEQKVVDREYRHNCQVACISLL